MADKPPQFRAPGWRPRKAWEPGRGRAHRRVRGRAGQKARAEVLAEEIYCRSCLAAGRHVRACVVDHVVPLAWVPRGYDPEARWNKQALCDPCHDAKSLEERQDGRPDDVEARLEQLQRDWLAR